MNKTAEEYKEVFEHAFVALAEATHGKVNPRTFANVVNALETLDDAHMSELMEKLGASNEWEAVAKFIVPGVLMDEAVRIGDEDDDGGEDEPENDPD